MNIKTYNSSNCYTGRKNWKPDIIVDHITGGSYTSAINTFMNKNCQVSAHFVVSKIGEIAQMVDLKNSAWCNGTTVNGDKRGGLSMTEIIVGILALVGTCIGTFGGILAANKLVVYRIEQLEKKVEKHNNLIDRTYCIEKRLDVQEEQIKAANHRIGDLEEKK